jgi:hypothetical protein
MGAHLDKNADYLGANSSTQDCKGAQQSFQSVRLAQQVKQLRMPVKSVAQLFQHPNQITVLVV